MRRGSLLVLAGSAVLAASVVVVALFVIRQGETTDLLPNLDEAAPIDLSGRTGGTTGEPRFFLGFASAAGNIGEGPLVVDGSRAGASEPRMSLVQQIDRSDGSRRTVALRAELQYFASPTHSHWHMLGFMRYELRGAKGGAVRRDHKAGFCLGDRYRVQLLLDGTPNSALYDDECGKGQPKLLKLREGISVGWGDDYKPHLEGQEFDVTALDAGRYVLVHRVNPQRLLRESDYSDNAASIAFELSWPRGRQQPPSIDVVARCPDTATCP